MIIWISSYPKSGNTWLRSLLSSYIFTDDGNFNFELLKEIAQFSSKNYNNESNKVDNYQNKISKNWIPSQELINKDKRIHIFKTHNALCAIDGHRFTDKFNTIAAIYIARDPRNIITSLSNHYEIDHNKAFEFLTNKRKIIFPNNSYGKNGPNDFNFLSDWGDHYNSWKNINFCPVKIIRYEDMIKDTKKEFVDVLNFLSKFFTIKFDNNKVKNCIKTTSFEKLSKMEDKVGFKESVLLAGKKHVKFFNLGRKNNWKKLLKANLVKKIEKKFEKEMKELHYL